MSIVITDANASERRAPTIQDLPPEILSAIFLAYKAICTHPLLYTLLDPHWRRYRWLDVAQVCRLWRELTLATPQLWSWINMNSLSSASIELMLARSGQVPLDVIFHNNKPGSYGRAWKLVLSQIDRIRTLEATHFPCDQFAEIPDDVHATALEVLRISVSPSVLDVMPKAVFLRDMSSLRTLIIHDVCITYLPSLPRLERLVLVSPMFPSSTSRLPLSALANAPRLEELELDDAVHIDDKALSAAVQLPRLLRMSIMTKSPTDHRLFKLVQHPPTTALGLHCLVVGTVAQNLNIEDILDIYSYLSAPGAPVITKAELFLLQRGVCKALSVSLRCAKSNAELAFLRLNLGGLNVADYTSICTRLCTRIPLFGVTELRWCGFSSEDTQLRLSPLLEVFPAVQTIDLVQELSVDLINALRAYPVLPNLRHLFLKLGVFKFEGDLDNDIGLGDALEGLLQERNDLGSPIERLTLLNCDFGESTIEVFKKYTQVVCHTL